MAISRSQMYRQLRNKGGIMNAVPRQGYFLGGIGDAIKDTVKGVAKGITGILKSDLGKAALIGGSLFGVPGTQFGGLLGKGSIANIIGQKAMTQAPGAKGTGLKGFFQNILGGEKTLGTTAKVFAGGTAIGAVLEAAGLGQEEQEQLASTRNVDALKGYLRKGYKTLNPEADETEVESFVEANTREYAATGGRIGYAKGTDEIVDQASGIMGLPQRTNQAGVKELDLRETGGFIPPVGVKEKADDIPAMLSNNEFVFTADAVRGMGNGDVNKGAQRLYDQMKMLEKGGIV